MPKTKLNHNTIRGLEAKDKPKAYYDTIESGLMIRLSTTGSKTFCYRYNFNGKNRRYTIGQFPAVSLSDARKKAQWVKTKVNDGIDPQAEKNKRKHQPTKKTFEQLAEKFTQRHLPTLRASTKKEYNRVIDSELLPAFKGMNVEDITKHHIRNVLDDKAYGKGDQDPAPTMANRIRAVLSSIFEFGIKKWGLTIDSNPVLATPTYKEGKNKRDRFYSTDELPKLWTAFEQEAEPIQSVLKMLLLTAQRKTETMKMKWDDIENGIWTIPAENAKNKQSHDIPLPSGAIQIINDMQPITGQSAYVFESPRLKNEPLGWIKQSVDSIRKISKVSDFRIHDLRRTAATYMAKGGTDPMIIGKVLNHKELAQENRITAIYNRHDYMKKKRQALNHWSNYLQKILAGKKEAKIYKISS